MKISWYGQSAFLLEGEVRVAIDPFGAMSELAASRGLVFDYPPIEGLEADLLLITHEHNDHNGAEGVTGQSTTIRSTAGTFDSPAGQVLGIASEHDAAAGTVRGQNAIFRFELDGVRFCHLGDLGQPSLRPEQQAAIGDVDVLFVPIGGFATIDGTQAAAVVRALGPRVAVPMHYRTELVNFLDPPEEFLEALGAPIERPETNEFELEPLLAAGDGPVVVLPGLPGR